MGKYGSQSWGGPRLVTANDVGESMTLSEAQDVTTGLAESERTSVREKVALAVLAGHVGYKASAALAVEAARASNARLKAQSTELWVMRGLAAFMTTVAVVAAWL